MNSAPFPLIIIQLILLFLYSCEEVDCCAQTSITAMPSSNVFREPSIGKISKYVGISGNSYFDLENQEFTYTGDTLEIQIKESLPNGFLVEERLSPFSETQQRIQSGEILSEFMFEFSLFLRESGLEFLSNNERNFGSRLFSRYVQSGFVLSSLNDGRKACMSKGIKLDPCTRNGKLENWEYQGVNQEEVFFFYDDSFSNLQRLAYGWIYHPNGGIYLTFSVDPQTQIWTGWLWIP